MSGMTHENVVDANQRSSVSHGCLSVSSRPASTVRAPPQCPSFLLRYALCEARSFKNEFRDKGARAVTDAMEVTRALRANVRCA